MNEKYRDSLFGHARFQIKKRGQTITGFNGYGTIDDVDEKNVLFRDNEGYEFIVSKGRFTFIEEEFAPVENLTT